MKTLFFVLAFIGTMTIVQIEGQILTAAAIIIGAKILIGKGFIYGAAKGAIVRNIADGNGFGFGGRGRGGHGHGKRSAEVDFNTFLLEENKRDVDECAKLLVCHLNAKPLNKLEEDEFAIATAFGQADVIDVTKATVLYDVAAHIGRMAGEKQCRNVYPRCANEVDKIMQDIRKAAAGQ